jgi:hypothetical protein
MRALYRAAMLASVLSLASASAFAQDLVFLLSNQSSATLVEFYASPTDVGDWEEDILGEYMLGSGQSVDVTIADGRTQCTYDLRMVFDDGTELLDTVDLCELASYTIQ